MHLMSDWTTKDAVGSYFHLNVVPEGFWTLPRSGFLHSTIINEVARIALQGNCDRVF